MTPINSAFSSIAIHNTSVDAVQKQASSDLSKVPSTIQDCSGANESEQGDWEAIRKYFSSASHYANATTATCIAKGKKVIDFHLASLPSESCAVALQIKLESLNIHWVPHFNVISTPTEKDAFKAECYRKLEALLGQDENRKRDYERLAISRYVFTKNADDTFSYSRDNESTNEEQRIFTGSQLLEIKVDHSDLTRYIIEKFPSFFGNTIEEQKIFAGSQLLEEKAGLYDLARYEIMPCPPWILNHHNA